MSQLLHRVKQNLITVSDVLSTESVTDNHKRDLIDKQIEEEEANEKDQNDVIPIPDEIYNWKIVSLAFTAAAAAVIIGYDAGFIGGTVSLASFQSEFGMDKMSTSEQDLISSNVVSVFQAGAFFGALLIYPIGELVGRKAGLVISGGLLTIGAAISLISNSDRGLGAIYAGRVLTGVGIGGCSGLAPIYVSEISPTSIRGKLVGCWELSWQIGGVIGYWINYGVLQNIPASRKQWLIPFAIQLIPSALFWMGTLILPESPRYLISKNKLDQAKGNLSYLRNLPEDHPYSLYEFNNIKKDVDEKYSKIGYGFWAPFKRIITSKSLLYRLFLSTSLFAMQNGFGINAITYYSPTIFKSFGISGSDSGLLSTGIFGILKAAAALFWIFFVVDSLGRRTALIWFAAPCMVAFYYIGAYIKIADPSARLAAGDTEMTSGGRAAQAMLYIWTVFYGASWNGTPWVINSEIFNVTERTLTQSINASANWFWAFVMGRWTGKAINDIGFGLYFLFAACTTVFPIVIFLLYPETKGVPLEAIDYLFEVPAWRARKHALEKFKQEYEIGARSHSSNSESDFEKSEEAENELEQSKSSSPESESRNY